MELTRPDGTPLRVLVVDDEVNIAELIGMAARYEGWESTLVHTGSKAVAAAKDLRPDAVVLDGVASGQEDHRDVGVGGAHPAQHLEAVEVGEHHVEDDGVRL